MNTWYYWVRENETAIKHYAEKINTRAVHVCVGVLGRIAENYMAVQ